MGRGTDIECNQKSSVFKYIPSEQCVARVESPEEANRVALGRAQEVKQGVESRGKLPNGGGARGTG